MPRPPRIQFPNACYHVINRGNYRSPIFISPRAAAAFEACLFEACDRMGWVLYAHVVMRNHFHVALRTPRANLAVGMQWLETTFATRFNRFRGEHGHLFQGRYLAPLVEPGEVLAKVINYIHLNPIRAKAVAAAELSAYRHGSFSWFGGRHRPDFMVRGEWLRTLGFGDDKAGWREYHAYLTWLAAEPAEQKRQGWGTLGKGWAIGSLAWRKSMRQAYRLKLGRHLLSRAENGRLDQEEWTLALEAALQLAGKNLQQASISARSAPWKLRVALHLRRTTSATIPWLARMLHTGAPSSLRVYLSRLAKVAK